MACVSELDLVDPLRSRGRRLDRLGELWRDEERERSVAVRRAGFNGVAGRTLDDTRHCDTQLYKETLPNRRSEDTVRSRGPAIPIPRC
jgi:hypothetical protein